MNLKAAVICLSMILAGCAQNVPQVHDEVRIDPSWPDPIKTWDLRWEVKVIDGKSWVGMPFEQSQEFRIWLNDVYRYVQDQKGMLCYYRAPLKEPKCL